MKDNELKSKSAEDLSKKLLELHRERLNLRIQKSSGQQFKSHLLKKVKLEIARIKTILSEKVSKV